jgi:hypothetical protein
MSAAHGVLVREFSRVCLLSLRLNPAVLAKFFRVVKICYAQRFRYWIYQGKNHFENEEQAGVRNLH